VAVPGREDRQVVAGQSESKTGQWSLNTARHPESAHSLSQDDSFSARSFDIRYDTVD